MSNSAITEPTLMKNAKQLLQKYNDVSFRDPQIAAEMFTDDGAFEMPYFEGLGVPGRYQGHDQIRGFFVFVRELFPDLQIVNTTVVCESADGRSYGFGVVVSVDGPSLFIDRSHVWQALHIANEIG